MPVSALAKRPSGIHIDPLDATSPGFAARGAQEPKQILNERRMAHFDDHVPQVAPPEIAANEAPYSHYWQKRAVLHRPYSYIGPDERRRVNNISSDEIHLAKNLGTVDLVLFATLRPRRRRPQRFGSTSRCGRLVSA